jgi:hypothetical protein
LTAATEFAVNCKTLKIAVDCKKSGRRLGMPEHGEGTLALSDLTKETVLKTVSEFDGLGREAFLARYGFGKSRGYFLQHGGKRYDSKPIAGVISEKGRDELRMLNKRD